MKTCLVSPVQRQTPSVYLSAFHTTHLKTCSRSTGWHLSRIELFKSTMFVKICIIVSLLLQLQWINTVYVLLNPTTLNLSTWNIWCHFHYGRGKFEDRPKFNHVQPFVYHMSWCACSHVIPLQLMNQCMSGNMQKRFVHMIEKYIAIITG